MTQISPEPLSENQVYTAWWFGTFFIFPYIVNNHPNWVIFFRGVESTNQYISLYRADKQQFTWHVAKTHRATSKGRNNERQTPPGCKAATTQKHVLGGTSDQNAWTFTNGVPADSVALEKTKNVFGLCRIWRGSELFADEVENHQSALQKEHTALENHHFERENTFGNRGLCTARFYDERVIRNMCVVHQDNVHAECKCSHV